MSGQPPRKRVLFLCTHNSARSQMAEGLLRDLGADRFEAFSAGTQATHVRPLAIRAMAELGIDISGQASKTLDRYVDEPFDTVITVCDQANEACPVFFCARERLHWSFPDPSRAEGTDEQQLAVYRAVRDAIRERIQYELLGTILAGPQQPHDAEPGGPLTLSTVQTRGNTELFKHFLDCMNTNDDEIISKTIEEFVEPDAVIRTPVPLKVTGAQALKEVFDTLRRAYPDLHVEVEDMIAEGDKVVGRNTVTGTHRGEYMGIKPTGRSVTYDEIFIFRFVNGRVAETWGVVDVFSQLLQLGAIRPPFAA